MSKINQIIFAVSILSFSSYLWAENFTIGLETAIGREKPSYLAKKVSEWKYGDQVQIDQQKGDWFRVIRDKKQGWLHKSSFGHAKNILKDVGRGDKIVKDSYSDEVVTAGKGFNPEFEKSYKAANTDLRYDLVDEMEKTKSSTAQVVEFMKKGQLTSETLEEK